jgi:RimJ/RimL family protein N-acetyltransferase
MAPLPPAVDLTGVDLTTEVVRTARLVLRPPRQDDVDDLYSASQDPDSQRWLPMPVPYTRDDAVAFVAQRIEERAEGRGLLCVLEADGRLVGTAGLHFPGSLLGPGVGYSVAPWARGQGYAVEAATALTEWGLSHGAHRVHLLADVANVPSQVVARRAGFVEEGLMRACLPYRDRPHGDAILFSRLPSDPAPG